MDPLWLLKGAYEAPGWHKLEKEARDGTTDVVHFDRDAWAPVRAAAPPQGYEGLSPGEPADGMYVDHTGRALYVAGRQLVKSATEVIKALGPEAEATARKEGDAEFALEKLGRMF